MRFPFDDDGPSMGAHIRQASQLCAVIGREHDWLVQASLEKCYGKQVQRCTHLCAVTNPLPAASKNASLLERVIIRLRVNARRKGPSARNVRVDFELFDCQRPSTSRSPGILRSALPDPGLCWAS